MEMYSSASNSLAIEQSILNTLEMAYFFKTKEKARQFAVRVEGPRNIYKITITVEQVEPKL